MQRLKASCEGASQCAAVFGRRVVRLSRRAIQIWHAEGLFQVFKRGTRKIIRKWRHGRESALPAPPEHLVLYKRWIAAHEPGATELVEQARQAKRFSYRPLISVLTPVYETPADMLSATLASLQAQTYDNWEVCLVDGGSGDPGTHRVLRAWAKADKRCRIEFLSENRGIAGNTNVALAKARGEFIALLDHDDTLAPFALFEVIRKLNEDRSLDFVYSDRDLQSRCGARRFNPLFKPAWSPAILLSANYLTHFNVIRTERARQIGGFRPETDGAQDWDFFLRLLDGTDRVAHIPKILYHWRHWEKSAASGHQAKPYVTQAQHRTLEEHMVRTSGHPGRVLVRADGGTHIQPYLSARSPTVSAVVSVTSASERVPALIEKLCGRVASGQLELVVAHTGKLTSTWQDYYCRLDDLPGVQIVCEPEADSVWTVINRAARQATGDALVFLDGNIEIITDDWLTELMQWLDQPGIGVVGAKLLRPNGAIHHAGLIMHPRRGFQSMFAGFHEGACSLIGNSEWYRNYLAVSGAALLMRRSLFFEVGGFEEAYRQVGADIDLCLRVHERGLRVFYNPYAKFRYHAPSPKVDGHRDRDLARLNARCRPYQQAGDPFANVNLVQGDLAIDLPLEEEAAAAQCVGPEPAVIDWVRPGAPNEEDLGLVSKFDLDPQVLEASLSMQSAHTGPAEPATVNKARAQCAA
jgi:O-antigen biosynthesis protein